MISKNYSFLRKPRKKSFQQHLVKWSFIFTVVWLCSSVKGLIEIITLQKSVQAHKSLMISKIRNKSVEEINGKSSAEIELIGKTLLE